MVLSDAPCKMIGHYPGVRYMYFLSNASKFIPYSSFSYSRTYSVGC
jgi:hypothetical protein